MLALPYAYRVRLTSSNSTRAFVAGHESGIVPWSDDGAVFSQEWKDALYEPSMFVNLRAPLSQRS